MSGNNKCERILQVGQLVPGCNGRMWQTEHLVGSGRCCEVYQVNLVGEDAKAALKIYKKGPVYKYACDREQVLLQILHKTKGACQHLVRVFEDFTFKGHPCMVQELLDLNLRQLLHKCHGDGFSLYTIQKLARDIFNGLIKIGQIGFVHGDLKPANLLWSPDSAALTIIDFGLSFHMDDSRIGKLQSQGYRAPEVERWNDNVTQQSQQQQQSMDHSDVNTIILDNQCNVRPSVNSDVWSVGCVLAEMFLGHKLVSEEDSRLLTVRAEETLSYAQVMVVHKLQVRENDKDHSNSEEVLKSFKDLVLSCLHENPSERTGASEALQHSFFEQRLVPTFHDLLLLPTCVIRLINLMDEEYLDDPEIFQEVSEDILDGCDEYGTIKSSSFPKTGEGRGKVYIEYHEARHSLEAFNALTYKMFSGRSVLVTFYPPDDYAKSTYY